MSILPDIVVLIWLLPVVAQIILPLAMLVVWLVGRPVYRLVSSPAGDASSIAALSSVTKKIV